MTKRRWLVVATVGFAVAAGIAWFVGVGKGLAAPVSNCNRDCDDGGHAMVVAIVLAGLAAISLVLTVLAYYQPRPNLPEARTHRER